MNGDGIVWVICDVLAIYLYRKMKVPLWVSAIGMALLVPIIVGCFIYLALNFVNFGPDDTKEGVAFAGGFLAVFLVLHAIIMFVIGIIFNIYTFVKNKQEVKKNQVI